jgi:putative ATPase
MADLFSTEPRQPLAEALRPKTLDEVIGQRTCWGRASPAPGV